MSELQEKLTVIKKAGLLPSDFAVLVGVSSAAVSYWINGKSSPKSPAIVDRVTSTLNRLSSWVEAGKLPSNKARKVVVEKIKSVLAH